MSVLEVYETTKTVLQTALPIIENVTQKLTPEIKDFAERLYLLSEKYPELEKWAERVEKGAEILTDILFVLGLQSDPADELGFKAGESERAMSDFDNVDMYIRHLHDEVDLDRDKFENLSDSEKMVYRTMGMAIEAEAIGEKLGIEITPEFSLLLAKLKTIGEKILNTEEIVNLLSGLKEQDVDTTQDVGEYFEGEGDSDRIKIGTVVREIFTTLFEDKADNIIEEIKMQERNS